jgi:tRNA(fMet)-specific endonuclease VapC
MNGNYLLDTDILISYLRGHPGAIDLLKSLARKGASFSISVITVTEIEAGIRTGEKAKTKELLDSMETLILDIPMAHLAGSFLREYRTKGVSLSLADVLIAATAVTENLILLTYNQRHYPMPEIKIHHPRNF